MARRRRVRQQSYLLLFWGMLESARSSHHLVSLEQLHSYGVVAKGLPSKLMDYARSISNGAIGTIADDWYAYIRPGHTKETFAREACRRIGLDITDEKCAKARNHTNVVSPYVPRLAHAGLEDMVFRRTHLIKLLRSMFPARYRRYLEIGCGDGVNFQELKSHFDVAECVDPGNASSSTILQTSDEFFAHNNREWDIVFVDGLHTEGQVLKDVNNALRWLAPGGTIVMHDCVPRSAGTATSANSIGTLGSWNGDVWRAILRLRAMRGVEAIVVDIDEGCGLVRKVPAADDTRPLPPSERLRRLPERFLHQPLDYYTDFDGRQVELLGLHTVREVPGWLRDTEDRREKLMDRTQVLLSIESVRMSDEHSTDELVALEASVETGIAFPVRAIAGVQMFSSLCLAMFPNVECFNITSLPPNDPTLDQDTMVSVKWNPIQLVLFGSTNVSSGVNVTITGWLWDQARNTSCCSHAVQSQWKGLLKLAAQGVEP